MDDGPQLSDGDLVRLARGGDPVAFRLLVERHQSAARARARRLCPNPSDVDDTVQESFLQAFIALDGLREPDRFAGWLAGIVLNVCRRLHRGEQLTLLPDWPEPLHPTSADGQPSADDLDVIQRVAAVGEQRRDRLSGIEHAAAAEADDQIALHLAGPLSAGPGYIHRRFAGNGKSHGDNTLRVQPLSQRRATLDIATGDQQCPASQRGCGWSNLGHAAWPEEDTGRCGELKTHGFSPIYGYREGFGF